jgi:hypothetical protein
MNQIIKCPISKKGILKKEKTCHILLDMVRVYCDNCSQRFEKYGQTNILVSMFNRQHFDKEGNEILKKSSGGNI